MRRAQREIDQKGRKQAARDGIGQEQDDLNPSPFLLAFGRWWREVPSACTLDTAPSADGGRSAKAVRLPKPDWRTFAD